MDTRFSVLMSIYIKEEPKNLVECFESLVNQTLQASEWVIVEDGELTQELYDILDKYQREYPALIKRIPLPQNVGLGMALREGMKHCTYELVARMDTDDIAREDRFEKQIQEFKNDEQLDICGSHIKEFYNSVNEIKAIRKVPLSDNEIKNYQKRRDGFNHVTVMFKKSVVLGAGNYQHALLMEDSLLWVNMIMYGAKCMNIDDYLVYVRTGENMYQRRGGWSYFKKYCSGRKKILETRYISKLDYFVTLAVQFCVAMIPGSLRKFVFEKLLRDNTLDA